MNNHKQEITLAEIITEIKKVMVLLFSKWKLMVLAGILGGAIGIVYATYKPAVYTSRLSFMLNEHESGIPASLSSLAGLASLGGNQSSSDDKILFMATSRNIMAHSLLTTVNINGREIMLANCFIEENAMLDGFSADTSLKFFTGFIHNDLSLLNYAENKVMDKIINAILEGKLLAITSKKKAGLVAQSAGIITFEFKSGSEDFSYHFIKVLYEKLSNYYITKTTQRQQKSYNLIKHRADSLKMVLFAKEGEGADFIDRNINPSKMAVRMSGDRIRKEIELLSLMYAEVLRNLEVAKFTLESQTPTLYVVDTPTFPLEMKKLGRIQSALIGGIALGLIAVIYILLRERLKKGVQ